ncbi:type III secretion regulatory protein HpaA [Duganella sp. 1411]|uniref:hypothetical protein n=1 Tax=Duganella sp. 1411 TaxID=2806572 RepID=UPI001AEA83BF|nr:hypothetical protein [Duganella sp. 1411]MBP1204809.1 type III secretion regulatory protein HpaA [Duganella sp. 1411]
MRIQSGPSDLQQLMAQADIEASNRPTMTAAAAAQRSLAGRRAGHHHLSAAAEEAARPDRVLAPLNNAHIAALLARLRARNKRGAVTPEANDNAGELEELLLLLESQARAEPQQRPVIRAGARQQQGNAGEQSWQRRHDGWRGDDHAATPAGPRSGRQDDSGHAGAIDAIDAVLRAHLAPAATRADPAAGAHGLEQALLALHALQRAPAPNPPLTASLLRLTQAYLGQGGASSGPGTLAAVKQRLMALLPPATGQSSPALRQLHLFLPVLLLNAARPRTARQRDLALAKIAVLLAGARRQPVAKL